MLNFNVLDAKFQHKMYFRMQFNNVYLLNFNTFKLKFNNAHNAHKILAYNLQQVLIFSIFISSFKIMYELFVICISTFNFFSQCVAHKWGQYKF